MFRLRSRHSTVFFVSVCAHVCLCVRACIRARVRTSVRVCVLGGGRVCVCAFVREIDSWMKGLGLRVLG